MYTLLYDATVAWYARKKVSARDPSLYAIFALTTMAFLNIASMVILFAHWNHPWAQELLAAWKGGLAEAVLVMGTILAAHWLYFRRVRPATVVSADATPPSRWIAPLYMFATVACFIYVSPLASVHGHRSKAPQSQRATSHDSQFYFVLLENDGHTWCAYQDSEQFKAAVEASRPTESVKATYQSGLLSELTWQVEAESGDWVIFDQYRVSNEDLLLRRVILLAQGNLHIVQETVIHDGQAATVRTVNVTTLDGKKAELPVDVPTVPVKTNLQAEPFLQRVAELRSRPIEKWCKG